MTKKSEKKPDPKDDAANTGGGEPPKGDASSAAASPPPADQTAGETKKARPPVVSAGRIVHYVYASSDLGATHQHQAGEVRPAIVVTAHGNVVNLQVFTDQVNDGFGATLWRTSVHESADRIPGTWHWPERV